MNTKNVIVVGGGIAGLSAAYELAKQEHITVQLFEAEDYLGGRVRSLPVNYQMVDFGGFIIYPWYTEYNRIMAELQLDEQLEKIVLKEIFYETEGNHHMTPLSQIKFPTDEKVKAFMKLLKPVLEAKDLINPNLDAFEGRTISQEFRSILGGDKQGMLENHINMVAEGYCYGRIDETKMAFATAIIRYNYLKGSLASTSFFRYGNTHVPEAMAGSIKHHGGSIHTNSRVTQVNGKTITANGETHTADAIVFAQNIQPELFSQIIPEVKDTVQTDCRYTHFYTITVQANETVTINGDAEWGAGFYQPMPEMPYHIASSINMRVLYSERLDRYVNLNIVVNDDVAGKAHQALSVEEVFELVKEELHSMFPENTWKGAVQMQHWKHTMPVIQESLVKQIRAAHGNNGYYFAGDYFGGPSMEVAAATGVSAANNIIASFST